MAKHPKRPRDPAQLAKMIVDIATGELKEKQESPATVKASRAGRSGGPARAKALTPQRSRIVRADDGAMKWIEARTIIFYDAEQRPVRVVGINVDVTEQKRAIVQLRTFTETLEERVRDRTRELEAEYAARQKGADSELMLSSSLGGRL